MAANDEGSPGTEAAGSEVAGPWTAAPGVGAVLQGRYKLIEKLGEGAMGTVFRAERLELGRLVAVKFLGRSIAKRVEFVKRFGVEARAMGRLSHPNCVSVIDFGVEGLPYLVMDYVQGRPLREVMDAGRLSPRRAVGIARQILAGLAHAHAQGIVHRDVKPENVLVDQGDGLEDHVRIVDFGLAKLMDSHSVLTVGMALGTPSYMAPEQMLEGPVDERVDLYATGIVLFEMLTGQKPFDSPEVAAVLIAHQQKAPPTFRSVAPELTISAALEAVVQRALQKAPAARFPSARSMIGALDAVAEGQAVAAPTRARTPVAIPSPLTRPMTAVPPPPIPNRAPPPPVMARPSEPRAASVAPQAPPAAALEDRTRFDARPPAAELDGPTVIGTPSGKAPEPTRSAGPGAAWRTLRALDRRLRWAAGGAVIVVVLLLLIGGRRPSHVPAPAPGAPGGARPVPQRGTEARTTPPEVAPTRAATPVAPPPAASPASLADIRELVDEGKTDEAIGLLVVRRRALPREAEGAALLARLYFEKRRFAEGILAARQAVRNDRALRSDAALIKGAIDALGSERAADDAEQFLREDAGAAARPLLKDAAKSHASAAVRKRCKALLGSGARKPFLRWAF